MNLGAKYNTLKRLLKKAWTMDEQGWAKYYYPKYLKKYPIDEKAIFLESRMGKEIAGNIFYILKELQNNPEYKEYTIYVTACAEKKDDVNSILEKYKLTNCKMVTFGSKDYYRVLATAKYLVNDVAFDRYFVKRNGQVYLNTWHGTPWKCLGRSSEHDYYSYGNVQRNFMMADYLLYPNEYTRDHMLEDYTVTRLATKTQSFIGGYPRNTVFYGNGTDVRSELVERKIINGNEHLYFFMPTWREEKAGAPSQCLAPHLLMLKLMDMDKLLRDDEVLFVKLHPLSTGVVDVSHMKHIKPFPSGFETYDFLNSCDALLTDYSSVFFDFENSNKKIVLWTYDKEDYLADRGVYFAINELPYPQTNTVEEVLDELRKPVNYDATTVKEKFNPVDGPNASKTALEILFNGGSETAKDLMPVLKKEEVAGKKLVIFYISSLIKNGITTSFMNMLNSIDKEKYHVVVSSTINAVQRTPEVVKEFPKEVDYMGLWSGYNQTIWQSFVITLYYMKLLPTWLVQGMLRKVYSQDLQRLYPYMKPDAVVQFTGYEARKLMMYAMSEAHKVCLVHNDMVKECKLRKNQHKGVLRYCYDHYDNIAVVNEALIKPTTTFLKDKTKKDKIIVVPNLITDKAIREKGDASVEFHPETLTTMPYDNLIKFLDEKKNIFITIGRYSPEKDHTSLLKAFEKINEEYPETGLIIIGGHGNAYEDTEVLKNEIDPENKSIVLIQGMRNPQPLLRKSNCFVMSSLYEGMPMVIFEADLQGLPCITTDVSGMHYFLPKHGGTVTPTGVDGVYSGMKAFMEGKVKKMDINYDEYNAECLHALDKALGEVE